jgi:hypothetical protein
MKNRILVGFLFIFIATVSFAKCGSVTFGQDHLDNFVCYVGVFSNAAIGQGFEYTSQYTITSGDITEPLSTTYVVAAPECSISDPQVADPSSGNKDKISINQVRSICDAKLPGTNYIELPYGFDRIGPNKVDSGFYPACVYYDESLGTWVQKDGTQSCPVVSQKQ